MNTLASQKQLVIAESELNRANLVHDLATLRHMGFSAATIGSCTSSVVDLVAGLVPVPRSQPSTSVSPAWIQTVMQVVNLWRHWNAAGRDR